MHQTSPLCSIVNANIESLEQGQQLLKSITLDAYQHRASTITNSSIGEHFRHILDMYLALMTGLDSGLVDINVRRRGAEVETSPESAMNEIQKIKQWLRSLDKDSNPEFRLHTEVAISETKSVDIQSHLTRELIFTSNHAVHHYAIMRIIAKLQGLEVDDALGIAAATASNLRNIRRKAS